nr:hypothetical protein [Pedobacter sp. ASV19]
MLSLLHKTLAREFYTQHAGLFLFLFYLIFGAVEPGQMLNYHKSLLMAISSSPLALFSCCLLWILYALKCVLFIHKQQKLTNHTFLNLLTTLSPGKQIKVWAKLYITLFLPVLVYIVLILVTSVYIKHYGNVPGIFLFTGILISAAAFYNYRLSNYGFIQPKKLIRKPFPSFRKPETLWPVFYVIQQQTIMFFVCKVLSFLLFKAMLWMFADIGPDVRVALFGLLAAILSHTVLVAMLLKHEAACFSFIRSLPVLRRKVLLNTLLVLLILFIPELLFYFQTVGFQPVPMVQGLIFSMAGLFSFKMVLTSVGGNENIYLKFILLMFASSTVAILAHQVLLFSLLLSVLSMAYFCYSYYRVDYKCMNMDD